jgi:hypothetical protein
VKLSICKEAEDRLLGMNIKILNWKKEIPALVAIARSVLNRFAFTTIFQQFFFFFGYNRIVVHFSVIK